MWHLQQVAPIRSGHSVTVTPPEVQIPCDRATEPTLKITRILLSDLFFSVLVYFPRFWVKIITKKSINYFAILLSEFKLFPRKASEQIHPSPHISLETLTQETVLLFVWVTVWSDYLAPAAACSATKLKNNLWKTGRKSHADCSEYIMTHRRGFTQLISKAVKGLNVWGTLWCVLIKNVSLLFALCFDFSLHFYLLQ